MPTRVEMEAEESSVSSDDGFDEAFAAHIAAASAPIPVISSTACGVASCQLCGAAAPGQLLSQRERIRSLQPHRPARVCFEEIFGRRLWDGLATVGQCQRAASAVRCAMLASPDTDDYTDGSGRLLAPDSPVADNALSAERDLIRGLRDSVEARVIDEYGNVECVGCLLSWICGHGEWSGAGAVPEVLVSFDRNTGALSGTFAPHVDSANQPAYEVSAQMSSNLDKRLKSRTSQQSALI